MNKQQTGRRTWVTWLGALALAAGIVTAGVLPLRAAEAVGASVAPQANAMPTPLPQIVLVPTDVREVQALVNMNIRHGPSTGYPIVGKLWAGRTTAVISRTADAGWWQIVCPVGVIGDCFMSADPELTQPVRELGQAEVNSTAVQWVLARADLPALEGPGSTYAAVGGVRAGEVAQVTGLSADRLWWRIVCTNTLTGDCYINARLADPTTTPYLEQFPVVGTDVEFVMAQIDLPIYEGPGTSYLPAGLIFAGQTAQVIGRTADGGWWRINCQETTARECYISAHPSNSLPAAAPTTAP